MGKKHPWNDDAVYDALQEVLDDAYKRYKGRPLADVERGCKRLDIDEPEIWQQISEGIRPRVKRR